MECERETEKGREKGFQSFFRRSMEFRRSKFVDPRTKVNILDEGYTWVPKRTGFIEDPKEEISKNQIFRAIGLPTCATTLQEVEILPTFVYFPL